MKNEKKESLLLNAKIFQQAVEKSQIRHREKGLYDVYSERGIIIYEEYKEEN